MVETAQPQLPQAGFALGRVMERVDMLLNPRSGRCILAEASFHASDSSVVNLGGLGDVVKVKEGDGRNYLIPQGKAKCATPANLRVLP